MTLTHPLAFLPLQLAEEKLQLLHRDAVAGKDAQHVHEEVCKTDTQQRAGITHRNMQGLTDRARECNNLSE